MDAYIFGDTGGHSKELFKSLTKLGVNVNTGYIPEHIQIIHVGDLIHKGKTSDKIINFLEKAFYKNKNRWVQILGNHEAQHTGDAPYFYQSPAEHTVVHGGDECCKILSKIGIITPCKNDTLTAHTQRSDNRNCCRRPSAAQE